MKLADVQQNPANAVARARLDPAAWADPGNAGRLRARAQRTPSLLTEYVRHRLARSICTRYRDKENRLHVVTLDPALEDRMQAGIEHSERGLFIRMSPQAVEATCRQIGAEIEKLARKNHPPVVLVSPQIRAGLKQMTSTQLAAAGGAELQRDHARHTD